MLRDKHGISKKEKNHPQASDGSSRLMIKNPSSVPTGTENIITQNVAKSNITSRIKRAASFRGLKSIIITFL